MAFEEVGSPAALSDVFRAAMRRLAATVTVVSTEEAGAWHGMTATAVTSLSMEPPSIIVSVNKSSWFHQLVGRKGAMCVNLLSAGHEEVCHAFGGRRTGLDRFADSAWSRGPRELPYLVDAEANIFCAVDGKLDYGTHTIFVGRVEHAVARPWIDPLVFMNGGFIASRTAGPQGKPT